MTIHATRTHGKGRTLTIEKQRLQPLQGFSTGSARKCTSQLQRSLPQPAASVNDSGLAVAVWWVGCWLLVSW